MAAPTFTINPKPAGYDQTQKRFSRSGLLGLSGNYTNGTGIPINFLTILNASGVSSVLEPTYTGSNGPGQGVPLPDSRITSVAGYDIYFDPINLSIRIWNGITEVATGAIPAALTAAGINATFIFLRA